jgi:aldose sugar dehydrogenase
MKYKIVIAAVLTLIILGLIFQNNIVRFFMRPTPSDIPVAEKNKQEEQGDTNSDIPDIEIVKSGLRVPWEILALPDNRLLITERPGTVRIFSLDDPSKEVTLSVAGVSATGEGGLLGATLHPEFEQNHFIYLYYTLRSASGLINRVERFRFENDRLEKDKVIIDNIPGNSNHDGGRIAFGPDGNLYIATGDAQNESAAQDRNSLAGKILRVDTEGKAVSDNPFGNPVYSMGHRNPQGLAWDGERKLWSTEHGPSGAGSGFDELNLIEKGANYGWSVIKGDEQRTGMRNPVLHSGSKETWAPASLAFVGNSLFFGGLRGQTLYEAKLEESKPRLVAHFRREFGRIRAIVPAEYKGQQVLYLTTSNRDGRGNPIADDDRIIRIRLDSLK